jgi:carbamoyltransferase
MNILGLSGYYHDSAAALVCDGVVVAAAQEERFTRRKHDSRFPKRAVEYVLGERGLTISDIDAVAFYDQPVLKFARILDSQLRICPNGFDGFMHAVPPWLGFKLWMKSAIRKELNFKGKIIFPTHHQSHAASTFYPSPFSDAAFLTVDGVGEWETTTWGIGQASRLEIKGSLHYPHSLGLLYSAFTFFTGFKVNSGEYKVMGLAPYGTPKYSQLILEHLVDLKSDGSFRLNMDYFDFDSGRPITTEKFSELFKRDRRLPESLLTQDEMDLASSIQDVTEQVMIRICRHIRQETKLKNLCMAGGVALNCVANGKIVRAKIFDELWIQPAAGDAGGALGAALYAWHMHFGHSRSVTGVTGDLQSGSYLGPSYAKSDIQSFLDDSAIKYERVDDIDAVGAKLLAEGNILGWFRGRMEYGPRSLGARSILGDPRRHTMQRDMNLKIKYRESFRPFAPIVLEEKMSEWFDLEQPSPYMLLVSPVNESKRLAGLSENDAAVFGIDLLNQIRSDIPAVTHVDYSARIQSVTQDRNPNIYGLLKRFDEITHCPVLINTSFNVRGEPIVESPEDAFRCFMRTEIDYLVIENFLIKKSDQRSWGGDTDWKNEFVLD